MITGIKKHLLKILDSQLVVQITIAETKKPHLKLNKKELPYLQVQ